MYKVDEVGRHSTVMGLLKSVWAGFDLTTPGVTVFALRQAFIDATCSTPDTLTLARTRLKDLNERSFHHFTERPPGPFFVTKETRF
jgi:hypothetical protein